jgi:hypothetical protein
MSVLAPTTFNVFKPFAVRYCDAKMSPFGWDVSGCSNAEELQAILSYLMIRRLKKKVLPELPEKRREELKIECPPRDLEGLQPAFEELHEINKKIHCLNPVSDECRQMTFERKKLISQLFRDTCDVKVSMIEAYLKKYLRDIKHKIIIFGHHQKMLDAIQSACLQSKSGFIRIDGKTPQTIRHNLVESFRDDPSKKVAILSILAAGTGLNFTMCDHVVFTELQWNPGYHLQAEDRAHRIGQQADSILIQYIIANGTLDEYVWKMLNRKFQTINNILNDENEEGFDTICGERIETDIHIDRPSMFSSLMAKMGVQQHALDFANAWFKPSYDPKTHLLNGAYGLIDSVEVLLQQKGVKIDKDYVNNILFLDANVNSRFYETNTLKDGPIVNLHEYQGDLNVFYDNRHTKYYLITDTPAPLSLEETKCYEGHLVCFADTRCKRRKMI